MTDNTNIDVFKVICSQLGRFMFGRKTRWTIPAMRHLHTHEDMTNILTPFQDWLAGTRP